MYISHITTPDCNDLATVPLAKFRACGISLISSKFGNWGRQSRRSRRSGPALFDAEPVRGIVEIRRGLFS